MTNLTGVIRKLQKEKTRARRNGATERRVGGPGKSRRSGGKGYAFARTQGAADYVSGCSQENRGGLACALGKMEEKQANQVNGKNGRGFCNIARIPPGKGVLCNKLLPTTI